MRSENVLKSHRVGMGKYKKGKVLNGFTDVPVKQGVSLFVDAIQSGDEPLVGCSIRGNNVLALHRNSLSMTNTFGLIINLQTGNITKTTSFINKSRDGLLVDDKSFIYTGADRIFRSNNTLDGIAWSSVISNIATDVFKGDFSKNDKCMNSTHVFAKSSRSPFTFNKVDLETGILTKLLDERIDNFIIDATNDYIYNITSDLLFKRDIDGNIIWQVDFKNTELIVAGATIIKSNRVLVDEKTQEVYVLHGENITYNAYLTKIDKNGVVVYYNRYLSNISDIKNIQLFEISGNFILLSENNKGYYHAKSDGDFLGISFSIPSNNANMDIVSLTSQKNLAYFTDTRGVYTVESKVYL